jgi:hypothetical protein
MRRKVVARWLPERSSVYVCIGADVPAYYETSNNLQSLLIFPSKSLGLNLRPKKDRSRLGTLSVSSRSSAEGRKETL